MDPLTIATGAAALAGTAVEISFWLYKQVNELRNADARLAALSREVGHLSGLLASVEKTLRECHSQTLTLAHLDEDMWVQINNALSDCRVALEGLDGIITKLDGAGAGSSGSARRLLKKASMHFQLSTHVSEITDFTDKIYKSNCAMQTALAVVTVSLNFRTTTSQEEMFQELQALREIVEQLVKASQRPDPSPETPAEPPQVDHQAQNLLGLAAAAQRFHVAASATASTRYPPNRCMSFAQGWNGSEFGAGLSESQRQRIEQWSHQQQDVFQESHDSMSVITSVGETDHSDPSTVLTTPDLEEAPPSGKQKTAYLAGLAESVADDDDDDDDDIELDFLKNFEELACESFKQGDYEKTERCLQKAMESGVGGPTGVSSFKLLKIRLSLCYCLQEKWDFAASTLEPMSKQKAQEDLPVFHLLQAVSLAYLASQRYDDAHGICKLVLQGKKKILGKACEDYYFCLSILATIWEVKGDDLQAEAARYSIPRNHEWSGPRPGPDLTAKAYILNHKSLIESVFGEKSDTESQNQGEETKSPAPRSGHWTTLVPPDSRDGVQRADQDENKGLRVGELDTGKEFVVTGAQTTIPPRPPHHPGHRTGLLEPVWTPLPAHLPLAPPVLQPVTAPLPIASPPGPPEAAPTSAPNFQLPTSYNKDEQEEDIYGWDKLLLRDGFSGDVSSLGPAWYSTLEVVPHSYGNTYPPLWSQPQPTYTLGYQPSSPLLVPPYWAPLMAPAYPAVGGYPRSPGLSPTMPERSTRSRGISSVASWNDPEWVANINWIPRNNISSVSAPKAMVLRHTVPRYRSSTFSELHVAVSLRLSGDPTYAAEFPGMTAGPRALNRFPGGPLTPQASSMSKLFRKMHITGINLECLLDHKSLQCYPNKVLSDLEAATNDDGVLFADEDGTIQELENLQLDIAKFLHRSGAGFPGDTRLDAVACVIPDTAYCRAWRHTTGLMRRNSLLRHAKVLPQSLAVSQYFIQAGLVASDIFGLPNYGRPRAVVVLSCDRLLVECKSYSTRMLPNGDVELVELGGVGTNSGMFGSIGPETNFTRLVIARLERMRRQLKSDLTHVMAEDIMSSCRQRFREEILPQFLRYGDGFDVEFDLPEHALGLKKGSLKFTNDEIHECFEQPVSLIRKMLGHTLLRLFNSGVDTSHVLLAGSFAASDYLFSCLSSDVRELQWNIELCRPAKDVCEYASTLGMLFHMSSLSTDAPPALAELCSH